MRSITLASPFFFKIALLMGGKVMIDDDDGRLQRLRHARNFLARALADQAAGTEPRQFIDFDCQHFEANGLCQPCRLFKLFFHRGLKSTVAAGMLPGQDMVNDQRRA